LQGHAHDHRFHRSFPRQEAKALRLVRGQRKQTTDIDEDIMTKAILDDPDISGWQITKIPGRSAGFTFEPPTGPG
jgi:hypothetical protein